MKKIPEITIDDVLMFILENKDDLSAMDKISFMSYAHSSKFKAKQKSYQNNDLDNGVSLGE